MVERATVLVSVAVTNFKPQFFKDQTVLSADKSLFTGKMPPKPSLHDRRFINQAWRKRYFARFKTRATSPLVSRSARNMALAPLGS